MGELLNTGKINPKDVNKVREETVNKWDKLGFLDGLTGNIREDITQLYCCEASRLLPFDVVNTGDTLSGTTVFIKDE